MFKRLFLFAAAVVATVGLSAQGLNPNDAVPMDPAVRKGVLANGLTYYIRHNAKPEKQGEFFIYHDVGAIQEEDSQQGLAHFLEHMSFNGTENLPDKQMINWLESVGVKFGANLNAGTGVEMTQYMMSAVPLNRESIIDSALLVLHDWSHFVSLKEEEIDNERGVIVEELRQGQSADRRMQEKMMPVMYGDTRYAHRNVIGNEQGLRNFAYQELRDFYHRWYRTDLQCIVVVGDFDVDKMEQKIKERFSDIPAVENPEPKQVIEIPENDEPRIGIVTDTECQSTSGDILIKMQPLPKQMNDKVFAQLFSLMDTYVSVILNERLNAISKQPEPPFMYANYGKGALTNTCDAVFASFGSKDGESLKALEALDSELEKAVRFGFTPSEFERAKTKLYNSAENQFNQRSDRRNRQFVNSLIRNFSKNAPVPSAEYEWQLDSMLLANVNLEAVNQFVKMRITPNNRVVMLQMPVKEGAVIPTEADVRAVLDRVAQAELQGYEDEGEKKPLIAEGTVLKGVKIKKSTTDKFGATVWTLKNGATVIVYPTNFKANEISFSSSKLGGSSLLPVEFLKSASVFPTYLAMSGLGEFSSVELSKQLAGKSASVSKGLGHYSSSVNGSCVPKDLETMMQLLYLNFASPRYDSDMFANMMQQMETSLRNQQGQATTVLQDTLMNVLYDRNPRAAMTKLADLDQFKEEQCKALNEQFFGGVSGYTFTFVGNIDMETFKPMVEKYIGSLPATKGKSNWVDDGVAIIKHPAESIFSAKMETPKSTIVYMMSGYTDYNMKNQLILSTLDQLLRIRYTATIREEKGGTYGVGVASMMSFIPKGEYVLQMQFDTDPSRVDELRPILIEELEKMANEGPKADDLAKIKEYYNKQRADVLKDNGSWRGWISSYHLYGFDMTTGYEQIVEQLTADDIKAMARKVLDDNNIVKIVMNPLVAQ